MSVEPVPEETEEGKQLPQCGRLVFRGVELAYLNIDGEYMLPLAELLALVLPSTPRTTLFTRMEKMKVRRHFCQPEEIKLLKTVNGIHGSSANCTLLSKTEVEKYCSMYIDKPNEFNKASSTRDANADLELVAIEEISSQSARKKDKENKVSSQLNNNTIPNKLAALDKHKKSLPVKAKLRLTKVAKAKKVKSRSSPDCQVNKTLTGDSSPAAIDGHLSSVSVNKYGKGCLPPSSHQVTNFTQTKSLVNIGTNKKRVKKRDSSSEPNKKMRKVTSEKKRSSDNLDMEEAFESPLKIPKRSELNGHKESDKVNGTSQFLTSRCNSKKQDSDTLLNSDSSSNDSGFASTALSNTSTPTKTEFPAGEVSGLLKKDEKCSSAPCSLKLKTPKKNQSKRDHGNSLTLSPPALLLKRFEDSWLVEEKSPVNEATNCLHKRKEKPPGKKARGTGLAPLFDEVCGAERLFQQKQAKKEKKCRTPLSLKEEIVSEPLIAKDFIVGESQDGAGIAKKKKFKRKQKGKVKKLKTRKKLTLCNGQVVGPEQNSDFSTAKENKQECLSQKEPSPKSQLVSDKQTKEELLRKDLILERLVGDALAKFFAPTNSGSQTASTNVTPIKVDKSKLKKPKLAAKPVLKTNSNFKLLNLFPVTSPLTLQDGILSPSFTMSCPTGVQPDSIHPLWNWTLGRPVFRGPQKSLKPKSVQKEPLSKPKLVTNKARKIRRRRKRMSTNKKPPSSDSVGVVSSNVTVGESNQSVPIVNAEFKLPSCLCGTVSNIALSSPPIGVS